MIFYTGKPPRDNRDFEEDAFKFIVIVFLVILGMLALSFFGGSVV